MEAPESPTSKPSETVSEKKIKKTRKFTWTEKRKAQFEKMMNANREKSKSKKSRKDEPKESEKEEVEEKEITQKEVEELEKNKKELEKEEKQSNNIVKRIMDPHYLSRKDRHMIGTKAESTSSSEDSSENESSSTSDSDTDSSIEIKKKIIKKPKSTKKDWKLVRKVEKLRAKNKQLQNLFHNKSNKKHKKYPAEQSSGESDPEPDHYSNSSISASPGIFFC